MTLSPELLRLAAQIAAAPTDRELQRIFADALIEEGGDHAIRGELIQLELAGNQEPQVAELADRLVKVREARGYGFLALGKEGLARAWSCTIDQLESFGATTFAEEPLLASLDIQLADRDLDVQHEMRRLAAIPELARLRKLCIIVVFARPPGPAGLATLLASPYWPQLEDLWLMSNAIGNEGAAMLAESTSLAKLWHLNLINNGFDLDGVIALARSPVFANLRHLSLAGNRIGARGIEALAAARAMQLVTLDVRGCGITNAQLEPIKQRFPAIEIACDMVVEQPAESSGAPDPDAFTKGPFV